jgi:hypothetical protein
MAAQQKSLLALIEQATGKTPYTGTAAEVGEEIDGDADAMEAEHAVAAA